MTTRRQVLAGIGAGTLAAAIGVNRADAATAYSLTRQFEVETPDMSGPFVYLMQAGVHPTLAQARTIYKMLSGAAMDTLTESFAQSGIYTNGIDDMDFSKDGEYEDVLDGVRKMGWKFDMIADGGFDMEGMLIVAQKHQLTHVWAVTGMAGVERPFLRVIKKYMGFDATSASELDDVMPGGFDLPGYTMTVDETGTVENDEWL